MKTSDRPQRTSGRCRDCGSPLDDHCWIGWTLAGEPVQLDDPICPPRPDPIYGDPRWG